jgi:hypothetical protein
MGATQATFPLREGKALPAILWGGLAAGVLDRTGGLRPVGQANQDYPQGIASGLLGPQAFQGGWGTAALGTECCTVPSRLPGAGLRS